MRLQLLTLFGCSLLAACSLADFPPVFTGKAPSELPYRLKSYTYPAYRQGTPYQSTIQYQYDYQNRLIRLDYPDNGQSTTYQYDNNRLSERITYAGGTETGRTRFFYNTGGQLEKAVNSTTTSTYQFDRANQLIERVVTYPSATGSTRISRYTWQGGNMVAMVELDGQGKKRSEWAYTYDLQPNYQALLPVDPNPDEPRTYNNRLSTRLDQDYTGLIDLCRNPYGSTYIYRADGLVTRSESKSCSFQYNDIVYEAKQ